MVDLLNLKEGTKELRLSVHTVRSWIYQNKIPFVRLGRRVLLRREDLEEFVRRSVVEARDKV